MKKVTVFVLIFLFGLSGIFPASAARTGGKVPAAGKGDLGIPSGKWWKLPKVAEKLSLSKEEQKKMDAMYMEHRRKLIDLRSQMEKERLELEVLFDSETFNASACIERFITVQAAKDKLDIERFKLLVQVRELLGYDRFQKLKEQYKRNRLNRNQSKRPSIKGKDNKR